MAKSRRSSLAAALRDQATPLTVAPALILFFIAPPSSSARDARLFPCDPDTRGRILQQLGRGANRPADKLAATVGAHEPECLRCARETERTFKGADVGFVRIRREVAIATLAVRS